MAYIVMSTKAFTELKRGEKVTELRRFDEAHGTIHASGMTRARVADLDARYRKALKGLTTIEENDEGGFTAKAGPGVDLRDVLNVNTKTGRLRSDQPNEGGAPQADGKVTVLLREAAGINFFIQGEEQGRPLTDKETWLLAHAEQARKEIGPVQIHNGKRYNLSKRAKKSFREYTRKLRGRGIVFVTPSMVRQMEAEAGA